MVERAKKEVAKLRRDNVDLNQKLDNAKKEIADLKAKLERVEKTAKEAPEALLGVAAPKRRRKA